MKILRLAVLTALAVFTLSAQVTALMPVPRLQFLDANGDPLPGGKVFTYAAGTTTPLATYTTSVGNVANTNPVILDSGGFAAPGIWLSPAAYKIVLKDQNDVTQWTVDNLYDWGQLLKTNLATPGTSTGAAMVAFRPLAGADTTVQAALRSLVPTTVTSYGALCDGATDDTTAIQAAITAAAGAGSQVVLPIGTCIFTALSLPNNTHIIGQGPGVSFLKLKNSGAVLNTPMMTNSSHIGGNLKISIEGFTLDGNVANQGGVVNVQGLSLVTVSTVTIRWMEFKNIGGAPIGGINWTNVVVSGNNFHDYGTTDPDFPNTGAIKMAYASATAASSGIQVLGNIIDGASGGVGGVKLNGTSVYPFSNTVIADNNITVGDASTGGGALGIELYNSGPTPSTGCFNYVVVGNNISGVSLSSATAALTWGISVAGGGCTNGSVTANPIRWIGLYGIEIAGSQGLSVTGNSMFQSAGIYLLAAAPGLGTATIKATTISGNSIISPRRSSGITTGINVYGELGNIIRAAVISDNIITLDAGGQIGMWFQANAGGTTFDSLQVSGNTIRGSGAEIGMKIEGDAPVTFSDTQISNNGFTNLDTALFFGGDANTRIINNVYAAVATLYGGSPATSDIFSDVIPPSNYTNAWSSLSPSYNIILAKAGQYFQTNNGASTPNIMTWNTTNGGDCAIGGVISTNSQQNTSTNASSYGWTKTSSGAFTRAGYYQFGACGFRVGFGPATGTGPNPPTDTLQLIVEDTAAHSGSVTTGGVGIGNDAITAGSRLQNVFIASATYNPGTIAGGGLASTNVGVTGCAAGNLAIADLSTVTTQSIMITAKSDTNNVRVLLYNPTGGNITPGSGTLRVSCIATN